MEECKKNTDHEILKKREKHIANMIKRGYFLQDIYHYLKRNDKFNTSLFNFYKLLRSQRYPLIDSALKTKRKRSAKL